MSDSMITQRVLPAGSVVKIGGLPFEVVQDTTISGALGNFRLAFEKKPETSDAPHQS